MHDLVLFVAELVRSAALDVNLAVVGAPPDDPHWPSQLVLLEFEVRRSSEGDWFWRLDQAHTRVRPQGPVAGTIERFEP